MVLRFKINHLSILLQTLLYFSICYKYTVCTVINLYDSRILNILILICSISKSCEINLKQQNPQYKMLFLIRIAYAH